VQGHVAVVLIIFIEELTELLEYQIILKKMLHLLISGLEYSITRARMCHLTWKLPSTLSSTVNTTAISLFIAFVGLVAQHRL
jgi:hypothetical protein